MAGTPWSGLTDASKLGFRTACNAAANPASRPVKRRVIDRISRTPEAAPLFAAAWAAAADSPEGVNEPFYIALVRQADWSTLVTEMVAAESLWSDLLEPDGFLGTIDRIRAIWEKLFGRNAGTLTKVVASATGLVTIGVVVRLVPVLDNALPDLKLPLKVEVQASDTQSGVPIRLTFAGPEGSVPVSFSGSGSWPIRLEPSGSWATLKLHLESDDGNANGPASALASIAAQLKQTNQSLSTASGQLTQLVRGAAPDDSKNLIQSLELVSNHIRNLKDAFNQVFLDPATLLGKESAALDTRLDALGKTAIAPFQEVTAVLRPKSQQSEVIPIIDSLRGQAEYTAATLCTWSIGAQNGSPYVDLEIEPGTKAQCRAVAERCHLGLGGPQTCQTTDGRWAVTVQSIENHWYGGHSAKVTLTPLASALVATAR